VTLLKPVVLLDEVEVVTADDNGVLHLVGDDDSPKVVESKLVKGRSLISFGSLGC
jgi:hypothetical protein